VRISTDLSFISVVLVSSRRTRGLVSINLIRKGVLQLVLVILISVTNSSRYVVLSSNRRGRTCSMYNWNSGMSVRQHTYMRGLVTMVDSESIWGDTTDKLSATPADNTAS